MNTVLVTAALTIAGAGGGIGGWMLRQIVVRWCRRCGQPVDTQCIECRDRQRAANLHAAGNHRHVAA